MTSINHDTEQASAAQITVPSSTRIRVVVIAAAAAGAAVTWLVARTSIGDPLTVSFNGTQQNVNVVSAILVATLAGALGWVLLAVLDRRVTKSQQLWTAIASVVLLLSLSGPISADATTGTKIALVAMHLVVGVVLIAGLRRTTALARSGNTLTHPTKP